MTPPSSPLAPVWSWHRIVAWMGLLLGLLETGSCAWGVASALASYRDSVVMPGYLLLCSLVTLVVPVLVILSRRRLPSLDYGLAAIPPALCASFFLLVITAIWGVAGFPESVVVFLMLVLPRGAVAGALVSMARQDAWAPSS